jgi:membrane protein
VITNLGRGRTLGLAAEMAFWLFLSLLPLAAVLGLAVAKLAASHQAAVAPILDPMPPATRSLITKELSSVSAWNGGAVAPLGAAAFVWLASGGVHAIFDALELEIEAKPRSWLRKRLLALASCLVLSIAVLALTVLSTGVEWIRRLASGAATNLHLGQLGSGAASIAVRAGTSAATLVLLHAALFYVGVPRAARRGLPIWPGAIAAVILEALFGGAYGLYLSRLGTESAYQASLSIIGITMMTLWLLSTALLAGAGLNRQLAQRRAERAPAHASSSSRPSHPSQPSWKPRTSAT